MTKQPKNQPQPPRVRQRSHNHRRQQSRANDRPVHQPAASKRVRRRSRWAIVRFANRWAARYKRLFLWLPWPWRIVLVAVGAVLAFFTALIIYESAGMIYDLVMGTMAAVIIFGLLWLFGGGRRHGGGYSSGWDNWRRDDEKFMQDIHDAEQRQHEDEGRV